MARRTATDRMWEDHEKENRVYKLFKSRLESISTLGEVVALTQDGPADGEPGREFYDRFARFLWKEYEIPEDASNEERTLYLNLLQRLREKGQLSDATAQHHGLK
jgi:hypothetical protein